MVKPVRIAVAVVLVLGLSAVAVAAEADAPLAIAPVPAGSPVRSALAKGRYPWYDAKRDAVKPVWPPREWDLGWLERWVRWLNRRLGFRGLGSVDSAGDVVAIGVAMLGLAILLVVLVELWRRYRPWAEDLLGPIRGPGGASRVEGLPAGLRPETDDPWAEAERHRARGDYARAVICLFAYELLTLDRLRQVRLVPGRTGRQLVRAIADRDLRACVEPTLHLFEAVYYGHHVPSAAMFEPVWNSAQAFQRRVAGGNAS